MRLLVFGSLNIDHVYNLSHLTREGETQDSLAYSKKEGGKGLNQAIALSKAGAEVFFAGAVGNDGSFLLELLNLHGINTKYVRSIDAPTGHAIIQVDEEGRNAIVLFGGANRCVTPEMIDSVLSDFGEGDYVLIQNEISGLEHILRTARRAGVRVALNPSPITDDLLRAPLELVDWFILNEIEGYGMTKKTDADEILTDLLKKYPDSHVLLTLGEKGSVYADSYRRITQAAIPAIAVDSTAAGDTFTGYFLHSVLSGENVERALLKASHASAISVSRLGAGCSIPYEREVADAISAFPG